MTPSPSLKPRSATTSALAFFATLSLFAAPLLANGGTVRVSRAPVGPYLVSVFTSPTPLRTGEVDVSVLVQDSAGDVVAELPIVVEAELADSVPAVMHRADRGQATNKLFQAAKFRLDVPGEWQFRIRLLEYDPVVFQATLSKPTLLDHPYLLALLILLPIGVTAWLLSRREADADDGASGVGRRASGPSNL